MTHLFGMVTLEEHLGYGIVPFGYVKIAMENGYL